MAGLDVFLSRTAVVPVIAQRFFALMNDFLCVWINDGFAVMIVVTINPQCAMNPFLCLVKETTATFRLKEGFSSAAVTRLETEEAFYLDSALNKDVVCARR